VWGGGEGRQSSGRFCQKKRARGAKLGNHEKQNAHDVSFDLGVFLFSPEPAPSSAPLVTESKEEARSLYNSRRERSRARRCVEDSSYLCKKSRKLAFVPWGQMQVNFDFLGVRLVYPSCKRGVLPRGLDGGGGRSA
jgi:hypothetical protein